MLDEEHDGPEQDEHDHNIYSLGRMGEHNVVIVCLPAGLMGNYPAAAVAMQQRATFKSVRFSQPHQGHGGVTQYDFGKATPSGFQRTGFPQLVADDTTRSYQQAASQPTPRENEACGAHIET